MIRIRINCQYGSVLDFLNARAYIQTMEPTWIEILKELMKKAGDNPYSLAEKTGISQPTINRILKGKHAEPTLSTAKAISRAYKITVSQLIGEVPIVLDEQGNVIEAFYVSDEKRKTLHHQIEEIPEEHLDHAITNLTYVRCLPTRSQDEKEAIEHDSQEKRVGVKDRRNPDNAEAKPPDAERRKEKRRKGDGWNSEGIRFWKEH